MALMPGLTFKISDQFPAKSGPCIAGPYYFIGYFIVKCRIIPTQRSPALGHSLFRENK
jgi:hypothetical protein